MTGVQLWYRIGCEAISRGQCVKTTALAVTADSVCGAAHMCALHIELAVADFLCGTAQAANGCAYRRLNVEDRRQLAH